MMSYTVLIILAVLVSVGLFFLLIYLRRKVGITAKVPGNLRVVEIFFFSWIFVFMLGLIGIQYGSNYIDTHIDEARTQLQANPQWAQIANEMINEKRNVDEIAAMLDASLDSIAPYATEFISVSSYVSTENIDLDALQSIVGAPDPAAKICDTLVSVGRTFVLYARLIVLGLVVLGFLLLFGIEYFLMKHRGWSDDGHSSYTSI